MIYRPSLRHYQKTGPAKFSMAGCTPNRARPDLMPKQGRDWEWTSAAPTNGGAADRAAGGYWMEPEIHFIRDTEILVPDLAGWRRERMPRLPRDHRFEIVPD